LNGSLVGFSKDSMSPAEFDVTSLVKIGQDNLLAVQVFRWNDGSYLEKQVSFSFFIYFFLSFFLFFQH